MAILDTIHGLLALAVENGASDIHIKSNKPACLRMSGHLEPVEMDVVTPDDVREFIEQTVPEQFYEDWTKNRQVDYSYSVENVGRFRVNGFLQRGSPGVVLRHVNDNPPTFEQLNIGFPTPGFGLLQERTDKLIVHRMTGLTGFIEACNRGACQHEITHSIQQFVANKFVFAAQAFWIDDLIAINDHRVFERATAGEPHGLQCLNIACEPERPGKRDVACEQAGSQTHRHLLGPDRFGFKFDLGF